MKEIWKDIKGYEGLYKVSSLGNIKSLSRSYRLGKSIVYKKEKILKPVLRNTGYYYISFLKNNQRKDLPVHRVVASTFIENPNNYNVVNHKDENKLNNAVSNLEWCNTKYNCNYGTRGKRISNKLKKSICQYNIEGQFIRTWKSAIDVEKELGIKSTHISSCVKGKRKTAGGFIWSSEKGREETIIQITRSGENEKFDIGKE